MTKKSKLLLGTASLTAVIAIVPAAVISCSSDSNDNTTTVDNNASTLKKMSVSANTDVTETAAAVAKLLPDNSTSLDTISKFFNTNQIVSAATKDNVKATYSAAVITTPATTTAVLATTASDTSNTLVITVKMTLGSATATQAINITGFPTQDQVANKSTLVTLATSLSKLTLTAQTAESTKTPAEIFDLLKDNKSPTLADLSTYFETAPISTAIAAVSTTASPITVSYVISAISPDNTTDGSLSITTTLTMGTDASLISYTTTLVVKGFTSANQATINTYITAFQNNKDIKGIATVLASTITPTTGISMANITQYVSGIATLPANVSATFAITNVVNSTGTITLGITLTATNAASTSGSISVTGFQTSTAALDAVAKNIATTYPSTNQSTVLPVTAYNALKAIETTNKTLTINDLSSYFNTSSITADLAKLSGATNSIVLSSVTSDDITTGTLQFTLNLSFDGATKPIAITLTGFQLTTPSQETAANLAKLSVIKGNIAKLTFATTTQTSKTPAAIQTEIGANPTLTTLNAYFPTATITAALDGATITDITAIVPTTANTTAGTLDFTATLSLGSAANSDLATLKISFTVSGFLTANKAAINTYVASINTANTNKTITAKHVTLPTKIDSATVDSLLNGFPTPATGSGITLAFVISAPDAATGSLTFTVTASIAGDNAASLVSNPITVKGFITTNEAKLSTYVALINTANINKTITAKHVAFPSAIDSATVDSILTGFPIPATDSGITLAFVFGTQNAGTGNLTFTVTASIAGDNAASLVSNPITVKGFITTNEAAITSYITAFEAASATIKGLKTVSPSDIPTTSITFDNIKNYFSGIATPDGHLTATFKVTTIASGDNASDATGIVSLTVTLTADNATTVTSTPISISGFLTNNQKAVDAYINSFKAAPIKGINTILPSKVPGTIDASQISNYFVGIPPITSGINATFTTSTSSNADGTIDLILNLTATNATSTPVTIKVSGFETSQMAVTKFATTLGSATYPVLDAKKSETATQVFDALKTNSNLQLNDFVAYFTTSSITDSISANLAGTTITSMTLVPVDSATLAAGTLQIKLLLTFEGKTANSTITLSGLAQETITDQEKIANQNTVNTIATNISNFHPTTTQTSLTVEKANEKILAITSLTTFDQLSEFLSTADLKTLNDSITTGVTYTLSVEPPTGSDKSQGIISFSIVLSKGASTTAVSKNVSFTIGGFNKVLSSISIPLWSTADASASTIYANYWSTTAPTTPGLGNVASGNSLYITEAANPFDSTKVLETSGGTTLPTFITNLRGFVWPTGVSASDLTSWTEAGDNTTGIATYTLNFSDNRSATISVSGFMIASNATIIGTMRLNYANNRADMYVPLNGIVLNTADGFATAGITGPFWGDSTPGTGLPIGPMGGVSTYSIVNANKIAGTANFLITLGNGLVISIPMTGYKPLTIANANITATAIVSGIATNITADTLSTTAFPENKDITFTLDKMPSWFTTDQIKAIKALIPNWTSAANVSVTIGLPTVPDSAKPTETSATITVTITNVTDLTGTITGTAKATAFKIVAKTTTTTVPKTDDKTPAKVDTTTTEHKAS